MTDTTDRLYSAIINLPCKYEAAWQTPAPSDWVEGYVNGHRDTRYAAAELVSAALSAAPPTSVPQNVREALDRMCTPLHESWLPEATAEADARCMKIIKDYIEGAAPPTSDGELTIGEKLVSAVQALSAQTGEPAATIADWLCEGALARLILDAVAPKAAPPVCAQPSDDAWMAEAGRLAEAFGDARARFWNTGGGKVRIDAARAALLSHLRSRPAAAALTDTQIDAAVESLFPNDNAHHAAWMEEVARPIARAVLSALPAQAAQGVTDREWKMPENAKEVLAFINSTPLVSSLLYDINLLPEQITDWVRWTYMVTVCNHMEAALAAASAPAPAPDGWKPTEGEQQ